MFLSIIIPTLNEEKYLPRLLKSIKEQDYKNYEIIVADANSKDKTREIARKYGCIIADGGKLPGVARNNGAKKAKGKLLLFLDADVLLESNFLTKSTDEIKSRKIDAGTCRTIPIGGKFIDYIVTGAIDLFHSIFQFFRGYAKGSGYCIFCNKKLFQDVGGFNGNIRIGEDYHFTERCSRIGGFRILKTAKIHVSMRRYEEEGRLKVLYQYVICNLYRVFTGKEVVNDALKYEFGSHN